MNQVFLNKWAQAIKNSHLPRWQELPEFELYMDQVINLVDRYLTPIMESKKEHLLSSAMVNNYVKHKLVPPPVKKRYNREHLAYLIVITMLKQVLAIPDIKALIDLQLVKDPPELVYNNFCEQQELSLKEGAALILKEAVPVEKAPAAFAELALVSSSHSFAQKMVTEKIIQAADQKEEDIE